MTEHEAKIKGGVECVLSTVDYLGMDGAVDHFRGLAGDEGYNDAQCNEVEREARAC